jgi:hypothetical protein
MMKAANSRRDPFSSSILDAMFYAVDTDDIVDPEVSLPNPVPVACTQEEMGRCLELCVQFWEQGADRIVMSNLAGQLLRTGDLSPDDRIRYKYIRARYKHLRFAFVLYGTKHKPPPLFAATVAVMGHLQDAFRIGNRAGVMRYGILLRALLSKPVWQYVKREVSDVRLDNASGFLAFRQGEIRRIQRALEKAVTSHGFHSIRKIVSRQVSFYDTLKTLEPNDQLYKVSRFLSAINGLMGNMHDDLVEQAGAGQRNYHRDVLELPDDIRARLEMFVAHYSA